MSRPNAAASYVESQVLAASPVKLVSLMFEGALRALDRAARQVASQDRAGAGRSLSKAYHIVSELRCSLDMEKGADIACGLDRLYGFAMDRVARANASRDAKLIGEASEVLRTLKSAFDGVDGKEA